MITIDYTGKWIVIDSDGGLTKHHDGCVFSSVDVNYQLFDTEQEADDYIDKKTGEQ
jgi:hypothetical protein